MKLDNHAYVYQARHSGTDEALIVALNIDDTAMALPVAEFTGAQAEVLAGSGAPPQEVVSATEVPPHGWLILAPR